MSRDLIKQTGPTTVEPTENATSRLKRGLMTDAFNRAFGRKEPEKPIAPGKPRVLLALANYSRSPGWEYAKRLERQAYAAAPGLEMKFACYATDNAKGVRRFRITKDWITDPDKMASLIDKSECTCGCYVLVRSALEQAIVENQDRPMRAVIIAGDVFHDDGDGLAEAALAANELRRQGTAVFLIQQGDDPLCARRLQYLQRVAGAAYFKVDPKTQQLDEMLKVISAYAGGGEEAVRTAGGQAAALLLEHFKQQPMPTLIEEERERIPVHRLGS